MSTPTESAILNPSFLAIGDWSGEPISRKYDDEENHYRRLFFDGDRLVGAVMIGFLQKDRNGSRK